MSTGVDLGDIRKQAYHEYLEKWLKKANSLIQILLYWMILKYKPLITISKCTITTIQSPRTIFIVGFESTYPAIYKRFFCAQYFALKYMPL
jgi:hypothetical protein